MDYCFLCWMGGRVICMLKAALDHCRCGSSADGHWRHEILIRLGFEGLQQMSICAEGCSCQCVTVAGGGLFVTEIWQMMTRHCGQKWLNLLDWDQVAVTLHLHTHHPDRWPHTLLPAGGVAHLFLINNELKHCTGCYYRSQLLCEMFLHACSHKDYSLLRSWFNCYAVHLVSLIFTF